MGRPTDLNDEITATVCEVLGEGNSIADACAVAGISESSYHLWVRRGEAGEPRYSEFSQLTRAARAKARQAHVKVITRASDDDWRAAAWFLERSDPANWGRSARRDGDADDEPDAKPKAVKVLSGVSMDEL